MVPTMRLLRACSLVALVVLLLAMNLARAHKTKRKLKPTCGGVLTDLHGVIQTPDFPGQFPVPIRCQWVIDASNVPSNNASIVVYLTQLYVVKGLTFTEYAFFDFGSKIGERLIHTVTEQNVTAVRWLQPRTPFLVIDFQMKELEGNQLRALDGFLDVYGFNITYEISTRAEPVRPYSCNVVECSFLGHCYASRELSNFWCSCFEGFSGSHCGHGPLCEKDRSICQNGATCRHLGSRAVTCHCAPGFKGSDCSIKTELIEDADGCGEGGCPAQCPFDGRPHNVCNCPRGPKIPTERARYEGTVRLANLPALRDGGVPTLGSPTLVGIIERQMGKYMKNSNIAKIDDLRVLNITSGAEVTFHFFGAKKDGSRIRDALNRLVERGRLGNLTFVPTHLSFHQEPTLLLHNVKVNRPRIIKEGDEFIISCIAQGSSYMTFRWYKDGIFVNTSKATRTIWTHLQPVDSRDQYTARLVISKAKAFDEGVYTCQVEDWGVQQCKSIYIEVRQPPEVKVVPKSITVQKGDNVTIVCISPNDRQPDVFGYNWTKNKLLFKMKAGTEVWEELHPAGSILKISNIQKSAWYSCEVISYVRTVVDVHVEVLNKSVVPLCPEETSMGVTWPETSPGVYSITQCPPRFSGDAKRLCTLRDINQPDWELPDFSACFSESLIPIYNNFRKLTFGYQNTTGSETMEKYSEYLKTRSALYPGEGERILELAQDVITYINITDEMDEVQNVTKSFYQIADLLFKHYNSLTDAQKLTNLQRLIKKQAFLYGSVVKHSHDIHEKLDSFLVDVMCLDSSIFHSVRIPQLKESYPSWFNDVINIHIESTNAEPFGNSTFMLAVVVYKNFTAFLPERSVAKLRNGFELQYEIISQVIEVGMARERGRSVLVGGGVIELDLEIHHVPNNYSWEAWNVTCALSVSGAATARWDMDACVTHAINKTTTRCRCSNTGTIAILLITSPLYLSRVAVRSSQFVVLLGCICCLVQVLIATGILLLYWWYHRSCLVYLKVQCCCATVGAMAVFLYALSNELRPDSFSYITTLLETFLLVGMSSHVSKLLIVYTELVQMARVKRLKPTVVGIMTGVPLITIFGNHLAHRSIGRQVESWWLLYGTLVFNIFVTCASVMLVLFVFLYFNVMRKLHLLVTKHMTHSKALKKRIGLLRRSGLIFVSMVVMISSSILYVNLSDIMWHYIFSISSVTLGFIQLMCYVIRSEISLRSHLARKLKLRNTAEDYDSDSANSPLSFFTKQEPDAESESAPPQQARGKGVGRIDSNEGLLLADTQRKLKYAPSEGAPSTIETYLHSISEESVQRYEIEARPDGKEDVDLELYNSSPKKYRKSPIDVALHSESEKMYPEHWFVRGHPESVLISPGTGQFLRDMPHPPDILTTRVCVELGLVPSAGSGVLGTEANILVEAPSIMLCNVEVEPCEPLEPPVVTTAVPSLPPSTSEIKPIEPATTDAAAERKQPEGREKVCHAAETDGSDDNLDGMLDRISHDLDYLLNRNIPEIQITPAVQHSRKTSRLPSTAIRGQIKEEDEEEASEVTDNDGDMGIAKTAC